MYSYVRTVCMVSKQVFSLVIGTYFSLKDLQAMATDMMTTAASRLRPWVREVPHTNVKPSSSQDITTTAILASPSPVSTSRQSNIDVDLNEFLGDANDSVFYRGIVSAKINSSDLAVATDRINKRTAQEIGAPKVPGVHWEDVGGLEDVKKIIMETVELPLRHKYALNLLLVSIDTFFICFEKSL